MNIGIIGGGLAGLVAGYELGKAGHRVTILERDSQLGGQVGTLEVGGERLERFYHHIFTSDSHVRELLAELGLASRLVWISSKVGFFRDGSLWDFVTPRDLLNFTPLSLPNRVRLGLASVYIQRQANWQKYEGVTARDWIVKYAGRRNFEVVWGPLLRGKFGESYDKVGMVWFWGKMRLRFGSREKGLQSERLGYLNGSFGLLVDELARAILRAGGRIFTEASVERIAVENGAARGVQLERPEVLSWREENGLAKDVHDLPEDALPFDAVIATVPSMVFERLVPDLPVDYVQRLKATTYQAAVCMVLTMARPLSHIYWLNISDPTMPFVAVIEHTNFVGAERYGGKHVVYLSNYLSQDNPLYRQTPGDLLQTYEPHLKRINPEFSLSWVESYRLFRDDSGQPIVTTNYSQKLLPMETPVGGLYLANTTQIYPEDRGMNYSIRLGRDVSRVVAGKSRLGGVLSRGNEK
ncbi:MAG: NAD(P)/FAD-dependent oxidoreductase [Chloroflexi bacterium]|nr:NAD(P)/FAD-dependent oxidoreductase [Chloroflexota bacterium]